MVLFGLTTLQKSSSLYFECNLEKFYTFSTELRTKLLTCTFYRQCPQIYVLFFKFFLNWFTLMKLELNESIKLGIKYIHTYIYV